MPSKLCIWHKWVTREDPQVPSSLFYLVCTAQEPGHRCWRSGWVPALGRGIGHTSMDRQTPGHWRTSYPCGLSCCAQNKPCFCPVSSKAVFCICSYFPCKFSFSRWGDVQRGLLCSLMKSCSICWSPHLKNEHRLLSQYVFKTSVHFLWCCLQWLSTRDSVLCRNSDERGDICKWSWSNWCI